MTKKPKCITNKELLKQLELSSWEQQSCMPNPRDTKGILPWYQRVANLLIRKG